MATKKKETKLEELGYIVVRQTPYGNFVCKTPASYSISPAIVPYNEANLKLADLQEAYSNESYKLAKVLIEV